MMKKALSVLLALCLLAGAVPVFASAAEESGTLATGLTWKFQNGTLTISGNGPMPDFEGSLGYGSVEAFGVPWVDQNLYNSVKALVIEEGVTHIGDYAFVWMSLDPANINIASSVTSIGKGSFADCVFRNDLVLPNTIKTLGYGAFFHVGAPSITIPDGIKELPRSLFSNCFGLEKVYVPTSVTLVGIDTFFDEVKDVYFAGTKAQWNQIKCKDSEGNLSDAFRKEMQGVVVHCSDGSITIPMKIADGSLSDTIRWEIYDDGTLELIGVGKIPECDSYFTPDGTIFNGNVAGWSGYLDSLDEDGFYIYDETQDYRPIIKRVIISEGITSIGIGIFEPCPLLTEVTVPASVKNIEGTAFRSSAVKDIYYAGSEKQWKTMKLYDAGYAEFEEMFSALGYPNPYEDVSVDDVMKGIKIHYATTDTPSAPNFTDVPLNQYYAKPVAWAVAQGITNGKGSAATFKPSDNCTRAEIVTFLWRAMGKIPAETDANFTDMPGTADFVKAINWAVENNVTKGKGNNTFKPNDTCTRAEAVTFIWRAMGKPQANTASSFTDMPSNSDFVKAINWAVENNVTKGKGTSTFKPNDTCTRGEIVTFLYRAMAD